MTHATHIATLAALTIGVLANASTADAAARRAAANVVTDPIGLHVDYPRLGDARAPAAALRDDNERARVSLDQAVAKVRARVDGKVIRAETRDKDGHPVHYIKILEANGRVRTMQVDGRTGRIL